MKARMRGGTIAALLVLSVSMIMFGGAPRAVATQDQPIIAGQSNTATKPTIVNNTTSGGPCFGQTVGDGLVACGQNAIYALSNDTAVSGFGQNYGVVGGSSNIGVFGNGDVAGVEGKTLQENANGVYGHAINSNGSGVYGQNDDTGYGVAGRATNGTGVLGDGTVGVFGQGAITGIKGTSTGAGDGVDGVAANSCCSAVYGLNSSTGNGVAGRANIGTGVLAVSTNGIALKATGKVQLSRSGRATVASGQSSAVVSNVALSAKSLALATAQKNVAGVYVDAAVPNVAANSVTIYLNKAVGASYPVAWMIVERP